MVEALGLTPEQHELRRNGIGASEGAKVLGRSRFGGPIDVWEEKTGAQRERVSNPAMEWGNLLEPAILKKTGMTINIPMLTKPDSTFSDSFPHILATPDALSLDPNDFTVDAKALRFDRLDEFGPAGSDEIPDDYLIQLTIQMGVFKRNRGFLACLFGGSDFRIFEVQFQPALWKGIGSKLEHFWTEHVEKKIAPGPDATESYSRWLSEHFATRKTKTVRQATEAEERAIIELRQVEEVMEPLKERRQLLRNTLTAGIGEDYGVISDFGKALWTGGSEDGEKTDWKGMAQGVLLTLPEGERAEWVGRFTKEKTTARALRVTFPKG